MEIIDPSNNKDQQLWQMAQKRASFKEELGTYLIVNAFFWCIWFFTSGGEWEWQPWPVWTTLGWGIGIAWSYFDAYHSDNHMQAEKEYEKLKNEKRNQ